MKELVQIVEKNKETVKEVKERKDCKDYVDEMMRLWGEELL